MIAAAAFVPVTFRAATVKDGTPLTYIFTEAPRYEPRAWMDGRDRFPSGAALRFASGQERRPVVTGFHASADATISFDASRVLFSGKRTAAGHWQIWELPLTRGTPRQITTGDSDCVRPFYLPEERIVYTRVTASESFIEAAPRAGGKASRLTFVPGRYLTDDVLQDGRILFEAGSRQRELFTVYPDGSGVEAVRCDHGPDRGNARQVASGDVIFDSGAGLARFTSARAGQVPDVSNVRGPIAEISPDQWIVTVRGKAGRSGLYRWANGQMSTLEVPANANAIEPVMVAPRVPPKRFPSGLVPTRTIGNLLCLNARISRTPMPAVEIRSVRVYTQDSQGAAALLGETGVESDGSFYVQVPADKPLRMEVLDGGGRVVRAEHDWFWMRPSEQRVCVGCHAGPERSPENKVPGILLKTTVPVPMLEVKK
jgi:hypothetical protein